MSAGWADTTVAGSRIHRQLVGQRALRTTSNAEHQFLGNTIENQIQDVDGRGSEGHEALVQYLPGKFAVSLNVHSVGQEPALERLKQQRREAPEQVEILSTVRSHVLNGRH